MSALLPPAVERTPLHVREVRVEGFRRDDGLWEFDATLRDTKRYDFHSRFRGDMPAGTPVHDMGLRVAVDDDLVIREAGAVMAATPFPDCPGAAAAYEALVGLRIGAGWTRRVRERVAPVAGCTHLFELLRPLATTVFQTVGPLRQGSDTTPTGRRPRMIDSCHGWRRSGEGVRALHPDWYEPPME